MQAKTLLLLSLVQAAFTAIAVPVTAQAQPPASPYPAMAPLAQYLMPEKDEIALARSGAPAAISDKADVMVLGKDGYVTAVKGTNGFLCIVERGWANDTSFNEVEIMNDKHGKPEISLSGQTLETSVRGNSILPFSGQAGAEDRYQSVDCARESTSLRRGGRPPIQEALMTDEEVIVKSRTNLKGRCKRE